MFAFLPAGTQAESEATTRQVVDSVRCPSGNDRVAKRDRSNEGKNSIRLVLSASQVSQAHSSSASRYGPVGLVQWSERQSPVKPRSSTARTGRCQRVQLIQYCPSIIIPRSSTEASFGYHKRSS